MSEKVKRSAAGSQARPDELGHVLRAARASPLLDLADEQALASRWRDHGDLRAAERLVASHLRLVVKIAVGYRGYGLPLPDLVGEGNLGLVQAVRRFDPGRGVRLATYALWWIRAAIQEYIMRAWSLVRIGTTPQQKKLFFNLRKVMGRLRIHEAGDVDAAQARRIAAALQVPERDVRDMHQRLLQRDRSLNAPLAADGELSWQDLLEDQAEDSESRLATRQELALRRKLLASAMGTLKAREKEILVERRLKESPPTLADLSERYGISRERVRQIELCAFEKLRKAVSDARLAAPR